MDSYFHAQAANNALSNHRLLRACAMLSPAQLAAPRTGFFPSIMHTLNHILTVDWFYVSAIEGACVGYAAFEPESRARFWPTFSVSSVPWTIV